MYNRRVSKCHPRVEVYGTVDELNAALGMARATVKEPSLRDHLLAIQNQLVVAMGELATAVEDLPRFLKDGFSPVAPAMTAKLDELVKEIEGQVGGFHGWAMPGSNVGSAALDIARTVCRRAERGVCALHEAGQLNNPEIIIYLNRLSDLLWLMARREEAEPGDASRIGREGRKGE
jgi:cob(I)alamin adenosyltransferase